MVCKIFKNPCIGRLVLFNRCIVYLKYSCIKNVQKTCKNVQKRAKTCKKRASQVLMHQKRASQVLISQKNVQKHSKRCKNMHHKYFWTQFKNVHLQGPCSLRLCCSRPYCGGFHLHLLVFPFIHQFNFWIGDLVHSSFAIDKFRKISKTFQYHFKTCTLWFLHEKEYSLYTYLFCCTEMRLWFINSTAIWVTGSDTRSVASRA